MTINEATSQLRNRLKEFTGDSRLTNRTLWGILKAISIDLINKDKDSIFKQNIFETAQLVTEDVDLLENTCVPLSCISCRAKVPATQSNKNGYIYRVLTDPLMKKTWKIVSPNSYISKLGVRGKARYAYIDGEYIYFSECIPCFKYIYFPEIDDEDQEGKSCSKLDQEINIPGYLLNIIFKMITFLY